MNKLTESLLIPALLFLPATALPEDWPQLQKNPGHTGYTTDQPNPPYRLKWRFEINEPTHTGSPPIVAAGKVYIGTNWGNLVAIALDSGKKAWSYKTGNTIFGSPAFYEGIVYANSMDRRCHAVESGDGSPFWTFETGEGILTGPVVAEGKVFIAGRDGFVRALKADNGEEVWESPVGGPVMATPAYDSGVCTGWSAFRFPSVPTQAFAPRPTRHNVSLRSRGRSFNTDACPDNGT